jgi:adenine-specific DNA-methyltransferase
MARTSRATNLELFGTTTKAEPEAAPIRLIGHNWVAPEHRPTKAIPDTLLRSLSADETARVQQQADELVAKLHRQLGKPHTCENGFILYNLDCRAVMAAMAKAEVTVDLTLTSPPYNIGKEYERPLPLTEYLEWSRDWLRDVWNITTDVGALWLNLGYVPVPDRGRAVPLPYLLWDKTSFFLQQEVVWNYGAGVASKRLFSPRNEKWIFFTKDAENYTFNLDLVRDPNVKYPNQKKHGRFRCNPLGKNPSDVWPIPKVTTGRDRSSRERTGHPAQFPLSLVDRIVKVSTMPFQTVLDPFCGSGSAGIAAIGNGCVFVGAELRANYCSMAARRLDSFVRTREEQGTQVGLLA